MFEAESLLSLELFLGCQAGGQQVDPLAPLLWGWDMTLPGFLHRFWGIWSHVCKGRSFIKGAISPATALPSLPSPNLWRLNTALLMLLKCFPLRYMLKPLRQSLTKPYGPGRPLASMFPIRSTISQTYHLRHGVGHQLPVEACQWAGERQGKERASTLRGRYTIVSS